MNDMLSVIVPVHNTEKYLTPCLDSLVAQTYPELEIILIDDGSVDSSGSICDVYATKYSNFHVYHQENQGVVAARNLGIAMAKGEYVSFVDSDDWVDADFYETLFPKMQDADMVTSGVVYEWETRKRWAVDAVAEGIYKKDRIEKEIWHNMVYHQTEKRQGVTAYLCGKIFKKELLQEVMQGIDKKIKYCEDGAAVYALLTRAKKVVVTHYCGYHYIQREDSAIHTYTEKAFQNISLLQKCMKRELLQGKENPVLELQINAFVSTALSMAINQIYGFDMKAPVYLFPYHAIPKGSKVILYGAGIVGTSFYECLRGEQYAEVAAWVDKNYAKQELIYPVKSPDVIEKTAFDFAVIAIESEPVAQEIRRELVNRGVPEEKIIWEKPRRIR